MGILAGIVGSIANIAGSVIKALSVTLKEGGNILMSLGKALGLIKPETRLFRVITIQKIMILIQNMLKRLRNLS